MHLSNDLEWDGESKRIIAVGDGREKFGHAFMMDTGTSTGEIIGHTKVCQRRGRLRSGSIVDRECR